MWPGRWSSSTSTSSRLSAALAAISEATPLERAWAPAPPRASTEMGTPVNAVTMRGPDTKA